MRRNLGARACAEGKPGSLIPGVLLRGLQVIRLSLRPLMNTIGFRTPSAARRPRASLGVHLHRMAPRRPGSSVVCANAHSHDEVSSSGPGPRMTDGASRDTRRGGFYGLLAAALFGLSAPIAKQLLGEVRPQVLAGLLYLGAGIGLSIWRAARPPAHEAPVTRQDLSALLGVIVAGGVLGPLLMLVGLERVDAVVGSLLLNLEGPLTMLLAVVVFREHLGRFGLVAATFIFGGAALLELETGAGSVDGWGMAALGLACLAWAIDNNLTQRLSLRDPFAIVRIKALAAGSFNLALGLLLGGHWPGWRITAGALSLGLLSYGASVVLDAYALRLVGAAREAAYFATAPFVGALAATFMLGEDLRATDMAAMCSMAVGVAALLRERHSHRHEHHAIAHEHAHRHDDHHQHRHAPEDPLGEPHSHSHRHEPLVHDHPHLPDVHHRHPH
jgi:drug/metabolite transporter (DMT)-like permease